MKVKTIKLTVAQAIVKFLNNQYVEFDGKEDRFVEGFFTIFGHGNVLGLGQALEQDPGALTVRQGKNEQGMAHAAIAFAKQNRRRKIYCCTSSVGPGAANMVAAAGLATANNIPLLIMPGDTFATRQPDPVLQQIEQTSSACITTNDAFRAVCRYFDRINRPEQLMSAMKNAMRVLTCQADTGAVCIALPQDVQGEAYDYPEYFFDKKVYRLIRRGASDEEITAAADLFMKKKKPLLICGGGAKYSEAGNEIKDFAQSFNIPFGETQAGKSTISGENEFNLGGLGVTGNLAANSIAEKADLIIGVGTRFTDFTTGSKELFRNPDVDFIAVNVSEFQAFKLDALPVVGDAKTCLSQLAAALKSKGYKSGYGGEIKEAKKQWNDELARLYTADFKGAGFHPEVSGQNEESLAEFSKTMNGAVTQTSALGIINKFLRSGYIIVGASGSLPGDLQRMWISTEPYSYHMEYGYSCMGYEIAGALGVKLAQPDKEVYAMVGDGGYLMLHSELVTSIQEGCKINVLLFDNSGFGCINNLQMGHGMGSFGTEFRYRSKESGKLDGPIMHIDYAASAAAYGAKTYTVKNSAELLKALEDAKKQTVSTLIDIKVLPKTMTHDYKSWWHVGVAEVSDKQSIKDAYKINCGKTDLARKY